MTDKRKRHPASNRGSGDDKVIAGDFHPKRPSGHRGFVEVPAEVEDTLEILRDACDTNLIGVIFFGSRLLSTSPNAHSAADLFVVVEDYTRFYHDIGQRLPQRRRASIMAWLNNMLPPNIISVKDPGDLRAGSKCFVMSEEHFAKWLSPSAPDHFCRGRMSQRFHIVYARSEEGATELEEQIMKARRLTLEWVPLYLPPTFDVLDYCRKMLEVSFAGEIRPESQSRIQEVFDAQRDYFRLSYARILETGVDEGDLLRVRAGYRTVIPPSGLRRMRWWFFFQKSRARATVRWLKYMLTFDDWQDYIVRKVERRTGVHLELTPAERRFALILLWPKMIQVLRAMRRRSAAAANDESRRNEDDE